MAVRIGILGNYGHHNNGDEAILWGLLRQLSDWPEPPRVTVFSFDPADTRRRHPHVEAVPVLVRKGGKVALLSTVGALYRWLRRLDLLIIGGGALLMDTFRNQALLYTGVARIARLAGVPVVYHAVGAGPIETGLGRWLIRTSADRAASVSVRDSESQALLYAIGVRKPVQVVSDPAFGLTAEEGRLAAGQPQDDGTAGPVSVPEDRRSAAVPEAARAGTETAGADTERAAVTDAAGLLPPRRPGLLRVGISAMPCYYPGLASDGDPDRYRAYVEGMRALTRGLLAAEVPSAVEIVYFGTKYPQDVDTAKEILAGMDIEIFTGKDAVDAVDLEAGQGRRDKRGSKRVWILDRELPPQALIALMGELDMLIATRLHALILATVAGTPSIGIAYRSKVRAIFADNGRERWTVSPEEPDWPEKMLDLWREMAERLAEERQAVRRMADANRRAAREQTAALGRWVRSGAAGAEGGTS